MKTDKIQFQSERDSVAKLSPESSPRQPARRFRLAGRLSLLPLIIIASLYGLSMTAGNPSNLGVRNGQLAPCPDSPNCVSTQSGNADQKMSPIPFSGSTKEVKQKIKAVIAAEFPRSRLVSETNNYLRYEFTSLVFRFVDDVEFLVDDRQEVIDFRSASRVGHSDLGANRSRMTKISERLKP